MKILLNESDSQIPLNFKNLAAKIGENLKFTKSQYHDNIIGGVILKSSDGKMLLDNSFDHIIDKSDGEIRFKIAQILFDNNRSKNV